jgi:hypothetical protein
MVMMIVGMTIIVVPRNSHSTFNAADDAADYSTDDRADRASIAITYSGAVLAAADDALSLGRGRNCERGNSEGNRTE